MVGHGGSSADSYLADPTSPIPSHCASIVATSALRVKFELNIDDDELLYFIYLPILSLVADGLLWSLVALFPGSETIIQQWF